MTTQDNDKLNEELKETRLLLVEGADDVRFLKSMLLKLNIDNVKIEQFGDGGIGEFSKHLKNLRKRSNFNKLTAIGITRDTDGKSVAEIFKAVTQSLNQHEFSIPNSLIEFSGEKNPKIGVFVFPDCENTGELEDLLVTALDDGNVMKCVDDFINCCMGKNHSLKKPAKTRLYAWLAAQGSPHLDLWVAGQRNHFNLDHQAFEKLRRFLHNLSAI